jgi:RND superfamily putative drug exporter
VLIGGQTAAQLDFDSFVYGQFPLAILFVVLSIVVILAVSFRSVLLPIKAVLMNGFSVLAAYGATVLVFQDGYLHSLFGFTPTGSLDSIVPVFLFCVLFGLSTDYEVFLLTRIREEYDKTGDNTHSVALGLERTGKMITSAALIMVVIFAAFSFANLVVIKELGFALAVGVLVDASLIRALLVPAAMRILGDWNWWPGRRSTLIIPRASRHHLAGELAGGD